MVLGMIDEKKHGDQKAFSPFRTAQNENANRLISGIFVAFVEDNATISSIRYFENHATYFVQNRRK